MTFVELRTKGSAPYSGLHIGLVTLHSAIQVTVTSSLLQHSLFNRPQRKTKPYTREKLKNRIIISCIHRYLNEHEKPPPSETDNYLLTFRENLMFLASGNMEP
jgi:hypothetical protein